MHVLTEENFDREAKPLLHRIFIDHNGTEPFAGQVSERLLLHFPIGGDPDKNDSSERQLAEAIAFAVQSIGENGCYVIAAWQDKFHSPTKNYYGYIPVTELVNSIAAPPGSSTFFWKQLNMPWGVDFCLFSERGTWALYKTIDDYGFLGGSHEFMKLVHQTYPDIENQVLEWLHDFKLAQMDGEEIDVEWLIQILTHVYGEETARKLLIDSKLVK